MTPGAQKVKVKRDGPRGWHWIAAAHYDPAVHQLVDDPAPPAPAPSAASPGAPAAAKRRGRPPKHTPT